MAENRFLGKKNIKIAGLPLPHIIYNTYKCYKNYILKLSLDIFFDINRPFASFTFVNQDLHPKWYSYFSKNSFEKQLYKYGYH